MRVYWRYACDFGHDWEIFKEEALEEDPADTRCPEGHEAVTLRKERPIDEVQVTIRPAGRLVDTVTGQVSMAGRYSLVVSSLQGHGELESKRTYTWREILGLIERFQGRTWERAKELLEKLPTDSKF